MRPVRLCDLEALDRELGPALRDAIDEVARGGRFVLGDTVAGFERALAAHHGVAHAVGVGSGSDALVLALGAVGVGPGDVVVTSPLSFIATAEAVVRVGARLCFADVDDSGGLDAEAVTRAIELADDGVAAVLPVHLYGRACEGIDAGDRPVVHDAAQAIGARVDGAALGARGPACLSFFPSKNLGGWGDGGAVLTDDPDLAARVRRGRVHGREAGAFATLGLNSRLDAIQAAVLEVKLRHLGDHDARRRGTVARYREGLAGLEGIALPAPLRAQDTPHLFTIRVASDRDRLGRHLADAGIESRVYYPRLLGDEPAIAPHVVGERPLPVARRLSRQVLSLPLHPYLTDADVDRVIAAVCSWRARPSSP